jgi:hypothetical protein
VYKAKLGFFLEKICESGIEGIISKVVLLKLCQ